MYRQTEPSGKLSARKRRSSDSTPRITKFFTTVKRERSNSESKNAKRKEKIDSTNPDVPSSQSESEAIYSLEDLKNLLGLGNPPSDSESEDVGLENLPKNVYSKILSILDLHSVSSLSLTSTKLSKKVKNYVASYEFYRRFQLENLEFLNNSFRQEDDEFLEKDPFTACGVLIKSITITMDTKIRANIFLNICRNLREKLGGSLHGFGRILETVTENWKFCERRVMIKAAILIDHDLRRNLIKILTSKAGQFPGLEMKVRSGLTQLFLNRNQEIDESSPQEIIDFGAWLSILIRNVIEKYQGRLYYVLFGPTRSSRIGEFVDWDYFCENSEDVRLVLRRSPSNYKKRLTTLLAGIRAMRIMNNAKNSDHAWNNRKLYQLFLRIIESCEERGPSWSEEASSMALAIDSAGLLSEYLTTCLDIRRSDLPHLMDEAAEMVCLVRTHLYQWSASPATYMAEPLHQAFNHLAQLEGNYDGHYKSFIDKIWNYQRSRLQNLVTNASNSTEWSILVREELDGQLSMVRLLSEFSDTVALHQANLNENREVRHPLELDEQLE